MARARTRSSTPRLPWRRRIVLALEIGGGTALLAFIALVVAVYVARSQLPSFEQLKSSPNGQMIRVHAADGSVIFSRGPAYGRWLPYDRIPAAMRDATVSVEDRRFRSHWGVAPLGVARAGAVPRPPRRGGAGGGAQPPDRGAGLPAGGTRWWHQAAGPVREGHRPILHRISFWLR